MLEPRTPAIARDPAIIRAELERTRGELVEALLALRDRATPARLVRRRVQRSPAAALLAAFALGYWLGRR